MEEREVRAKLQRSPTPIDPTGQEASSISSSTTTTTTRSSGSSGSRETCQGEFGSGTREARAAKSQVEQGQEQEQEQQARTTQQTMFQVSSSFGSPHGPHVGSFMAAEQERHHNHRAGHFRADAQEYPQTPSRQNHLEGQFFKSPPVPSFLEQHQQQQQYQQQQRYQQQERQLQQLGSQVGVFGQFGQFGALGGAGQAEFSGYEQQWQQVRGPRAAQTATGRWSDEEHAIFLDGLALHGRNWKAISRMVRTRSHVQIRTHAQKYFLKEKQKNGKGRAEDRKPQLELRGGMGAQPGQGCGLKRKLPVTPEALHQQRPQRPQHGGSAGGRAQMLPRLVVIPSSSSCLSDASCESGATTADDMSVSGGSPTSSCSEQSWKRRELDGGRYERPRFDAACEDAVAEKEDKELAELLLQSQWGQHPPAQNAKPATAAREPLANDIPRLPDVVDEDEDDESKRDDGPGPIPVGEDEDQLALAVMLPSPRPQESDAEMADFLNLALR